MAIPQDKLFQSALRARLDILKMVELAASGHIDSSFSCIDILTVLYGVTLRHDPQKPDALDRDRFVLSKGHAAPALYAILAQHDYFDPAELMTLRRLNSRLQGHPKRGLPGVEVNTGSLGQGLSIAAGLALGLAQRFSTTPPQVYVLLSDGELNEGQIWEALMFAGHQKLQNLIAIVDANGLQYSGTTRDVSDSSGLVIAARAFGWKCVEVDGHSLSALVDVFATPHPNQPLIIYANTTKGKDGLFMENDLMWHGKVPSSQEITAIREHLMQRLAESENA